VDRVGGRRSLQPPGCHYLAGLALVVKLDATIATDVAIVGFSLVMFTFIELPLLGSVLVPDRSRTLTEKLNDWMTRHNRTLITVVARIGGTYLLISGLSDLALKG
jgi:Sap, sulfolipid-1-addressing protein